LAAAESEGGAGIFTPLEAVGFPSWPFPLSPALKVSLWYGTPLRYASRPARAFSLAREARRQFRSKKVRISSNKRTLN